MRTLADPARRAVLARIVGGNATWVQFAGNPNRQIDAVHDQIDAAVHHQHIDRDFKTRTERSAWIRVLDRIVALKPATVSPGHARDPGKAGIEAVQYTRTYLQRFEIELEKAPNSSALIDMVKPLYPEAGLDIAVDLGAKVNKDEMKR